MALSDQELKEIAYLARINIKEDSFSSLKKEDMIAAGLSAPLHPGAIKYDKEAGLM